MLPKAKKVPLLVEAFQHLRWFANLRRLNRMSRSWNHSPVHMTPSIQPSMAAASRSSGVSGGLK
jgi:hypothetical protein